MPGHDLALLIDAARAGGEIAKGFFGQNPDVTDKPDGAGPVTAADLAVNDALEAALRGARPGYGWLSEESADDPARLGADKVFIIDPIDGTRAFIEQSPDWALSLAVAEAGVITAAVVFLPLHDALFSASLGAGAQLNAAPITARQTRAARPSLLAAKPNLQAQFWRNGAPPALERHFRSSLAYRMCLVAEGRFDAMLTLRPSWEWDIAAGALIAAEAGAQVSDPSGAVLRFNNAQPKVPGVLAAGADLHRHLLAQLEPSDRTP